MIYTKDSIVDHDKVNEYIESNICSKGILIDIEKAQEIHEILIDKCEEIEDIARGELIEEYQGINLSSNKDIQRVMINQFGFERFSRKSKSGNYSFGADILDNIINKTGNLFASSLKEYRSLKSIDSKLKEIVNYTDNENWVHPSLRYTETSRMMFVEPAISNINDIVKPIIIAPKGYKLITADYSQQEPYILTNMLNIEQFKRGISKGEDFYKVMVRELIGEELRDEDRDMVKTIWLSGTYGSFLNNVKFTPEQRDLADRVREKILGIKEINEFKEYLKREVIGEGYVESYFGTVREIPPYIKNKGRLGRIVFNNTIQITGADMLELAILECLEVFDREGLSEEDIRVYFTLYDAITFLVREDLVTEHLIKTIEEVMTLKIEGWTKIGVKFNMGGM